MQDVLIIGGGVVGLSIACELAEQGRQVAVFDRGPLGQEASWAGAGMLPPADPMRAATPLGRLRGASHQLWSEWSERLRELTGIDNGYSRCGGLELRLSGSADALDDEIATCRQEGIRAEPVSLDQLSQQEPALTREVAACYHLP
jgi:glycine oxidase